MNSKKILHDKNKKGILIVDDHVVVRQGLTLLINREDDLVVCAEADNVTTALETIEKQQVDLAVVDISLDGKSGIELTETIKSKYPDLPVLILSMHDEAVYAKRAFKAGARGYVTKREAAETIITAIRLTLSGSEYVSEKKTTEFIKRLHSKGSFC
ncbi:MAG: response regulator [Planctomycetota bacterium]|jgi:DNA-binding NarL/FixJ family response regulator